VHALRGPECVRVLCAFGYAVYGSTPIRVGLSRGPRKVFVPRHGPLSDEELRAILGLAGVDEAEFARARDEQAAMLPSEMAKASPSKPAPARTSWPEIGRMLEAVGLRR
jgi:hypothetical protein